MTEPGYLVVMRSMEQAVANQDWDHLSQAFDADAVLEYPQSGEVFRGLANIRGQFENYPNLEPGTSHLEEIFGGTTYAMTPSYTVIAVKGSGDQATAVIRVRYPDGSWWWAVNLYEVRGERVTRMRVYFAPDFPAPDWRAPYREAP